MSGPVAAYLDGGTRLHLQHGPIDLVIGAESGGDDGRDNSGARATAFAAAAQRFASVLEELVAELPGLRRPLGPATVLRGAVAGRMQAAARPFGEDHFLTPMIAVAGAVADEVLDAMRAAAPLDRAYVNNGGDIALHLAGAASFTIAVAGDRGQDLGRLRIDAGSRARGVATSGAGGRSLSLGIADSVTVVATTAARADAAATLIANAVDLPSHPEIRREPANLLQPDSDLGGRPVVTQVPRLSPAHRAQALETGQALAEAFFRAGLLDGAALVLQGETRVVGTHIDLNGPVLEETHV